MISVGSGIARTTSPSPSTPSTSSTRGTGRLRGLADTALFLHDEATGKAEQLECRTHAYSTAVTKPDDRPGRNRWASSDRGDLLRPQEGAASDEAGELIYYRILEPFAPE